MRVADEWTGLLFFRRRQQSQGNHDTMGIRVDLAIIRTADAWERLSGIPVLPPCGDEFAYWHWSLLRKPESFSVAGEEPERFKPDNPVQCLLASCFTLDPASRLAWENSSQRRMKPCTRTRRARNCFGGNREGEDIVLMNLNTIGSCRRTRIQFFGHKY